MPDPINDPVLLAQDHEYAYGQTLEEQFLDEEDQRLRGAEYTPKSPERRGA